MIRRHLRTRNNRDHIVAVRERRLLEFGEACTIAGMTRAELKRRIAWGGDCSSGLPNFANF